MNYGMLRYMLSQIALIIAGALVIPLILALAFGESGTPLSFGVVILGLLVLSIPNLIFKPQNRNLNTRSGFVIVALAWIGISLVGALPFVISGRIPNFIDALFESISGFTTTGATILSGTQIETMEKSLLFWRSFTHWLGGMGVLVLAVALIPKGNTSIVHLMKAEVPGPTFGKLVSKLRFTARILYGIYTVLTVVLILSLVIAGMDVFDACIHGLGTAGTGGFSNYGASVAHFNSPAINIILTLGMLVFATNFNLFYFILIGHVRSALKSEELRAMLTIFLSATVIVTLSLFFNGIYETVAESLMHGAFQVTSIISTTGFSTAIFESWPILCQVVLLLLMFIGGSVGSTAGGLKIYRAVVLGKYGFKIFRKTISPRRYMAVRMDGKALDNELVHGIVGYALIYFLILITSTVLLTIFSGAKVDGFLTDFSAVTACINNVGPGLSAVGAGGNFASYNAFSKLILSFDMLIGRLEIFPMILLFSYKSWKRRKGDIQNVQ